MSASGKYDSEVALLRERTRAETAIVIVIDGAKGSGFSMVSTDSADMFRVAYILEQVALQIHQKALIAWSTPDDDDDRH